MRKARLKHSVKQQLDIGLTSEVLQSLIISRLVKKFNNKTGVMPHQVEDHTKQMNMLI